MVISFMSRMMDGVIHHPAFCEAIFDGSYLIRGFTKRDIRGIVIAQDSDSLRMRKRFRVIVKTDKAIGIAH